MNRLSHFLQNKKTAWSISCILLLALAVAAALPAAEENKTAAEEELIIEPGITAEAKFEEGSPALPTVIVDPGQEQALPVNAQQDEPTEPTQPAPPEQWLLPLQGKAVRGMGYDKDPTCGDWRYHHGMDLTAEPGSAVYAAAAGTVAALPQEGWGGCLRLIHGGGWESIYRCISAAAKPGEQAEAGSIIGYVLESAPLESGQEPHLHFELYHNGEEQDPAAYLPL